MKIPAWKRVLSYFFRIPIDSQESKISGKIDLGIYEGRLLLTTDNAIYSYDDKYSNFKYALQYVDWEEFQLSSVLLLGFGMGSIIRILEKMDKLPSNDGLEHAIVGVEVDEVIVEMARRYSIERLESKVRLLQIDAEEFIRHSTENFSLIAVDLFIDETIPEKFLNKSFLQHLKTRLTMKGILMFNFLAGKERDIAFAKSYFYEIFEQLFPDAGIIEVDKNFILVNRKELFKADVHWVE